MNQWDLFGNRSNYYSDYEELKASEYKCKGHNIGESLNYSHHRDLSKNQRFWIYPLARS
jgi:hypothetical protein